MNTTTKKTVKNNVKNIEKENLTIIENSFKISDENLLNELNELNINSFIEKSLKNKSLYNYPESVKNSDNYKEEMKKFRTKLRKVQLNICLSVLNAVKEKKEEEKNINRFLTFYKTFFSLNDFSLKSFSQKSEKENLQDVKIFELTLKICSAYKENLKDIEINFKEFNF